MKQELLNEGLHDFRLSHKEAKVLFDRQWQAEKLLRRQENLRLADNVFVKGTFIRAGSGQRRG